MDANKFGCFVAERRKELHMTQKDLAAKIQVTDKAVSKWERGLGFPDINTIEDLADALNVSISELMRSEMAVAGDTETVVNDVVQVAKEDIRERQKIIIYTFAGTAVFLTILEILLSINWNASELSMSFSIPFTAIVPGVILIIYGIICAVTNKKAKGIIPIGICMLTIPVIVIGAAFLICGIVTG